ncbi:MAG TPA: sulfotransferase [Rhodopila sp.]|nr:sulfotransferase [Rhodopila sp.]
MIIPADAFRQAVALQQRGDLAGAERAYRTILRQQPKHFQTLSNLGSVLLLAERVEEAIHCLRGALNQQPRSAVAQTLLARALAMVDRHGEALERVRRAIAVDPRLSDTHAIMAQVLADTGRYEEAAAALGRAIELAPERARFYYYWGHITRWRADDPRLAALEGLARTRASRPPPEQIELCFALAKAYGDCGDVTRAFPLLIEGGALQRRLLRYDEASTLREMAEPSRVLDAGWMGRHGGAGDPSPVPVFIVGMPRSGTTLVEQILASHPGVHALGERRLFEAALARVGGSDVVPASVAARWTDAELRRVGGLYVEAVRRAAPTGAVRIVDKLPGNFQYAGLIHAALPNARLIHTGRDPVDTCLSVFSVLFAGTAHLYSYDLGELGRYYRAYQQAMTHWRNVLPAGVMLDVRYEAVVDDLAGEARRIVAHCGLDWDDACLAFHATKRPIRTASHAQVRQPIYRGSVGRPRPPREMLLPLLAAIGGDASVAG